MKNIQPDELRKLQKEKDAESDRKYAQSIKERKKEAVFIGLEASLLGNLFPMFSAHGWVVWVTIFLLMLVAALWSLVVQFKNIGIIWSMLAYGFFGAAIIACTTRGFFVVFWWLGLLIAGALISVFNDIYRSKHLGY